jgi:hypothetical protein
MWKRIIYPLLFLVIGGGIVLAQAPPTLPPRTPVVVEPVIPLKFGDFTAPIGSTGSVSVTTTGDRTAGGEVYLRGGAVQQGQFEFNLLPGRMVIVRFPTTAYISGLGAGGGQLTLTNLTFRLESGTILETGTGFIRFRSNTGSNHLHRLYMGGTLNVGTTIANPPGDYHSSVQLIIEAY